MQCQVHRGAKGLVYTTLEGVEEVEVAGASDGEADNIDINVEGARPLAGAVVVEKASQVRTDIPTRTTII